MKLLTLFALVCLLPMMVSANQVEAPPDVAAPPADAEVTDSGLASKVVTKGTGSVHPDAWDSVTVHYTGWTTDGKMFDSSVTRGQPATFALNQVIPGWTEGLQLMTVGSHYKFFVPPALAYGERAPSPQIPPNSMLIFEVELVSVLAGR